MNFRYFFSGLLFLTFSIFSIWFKKRKKINDDEDGIPSLLFIRYIVAVITSGICGIVLIIKSLPI